MASGNVRAGPLLPLAPSQPESRSRSRADLRHSGRGETSDYWLVPVRAGARAEPVTDGAMPADNIWGAPAWQQTPWQVSACSQCWPPSSSPRWPWSPGAKVSPEPMVTRAWHLLRIKHETLIVKSRERASGGLYAQVARRQAGPDQVRPRLEVWVPMLRVFVVTWYKGRCFNHLKALKSQKLCNWWASMEEFKEEALEKLFLSTLDYIL